MSCVICQLGTTEPGLVTVTLERDGAILVVKDVPASVCTNCGERYFDAATTDRLLAAADRAFKQGAELEVTRLQTA
ncbi:MAG: type II toxin-antitoxin system MqsA family antitoxin [Bacteroidetes bacterium]|nr:type II toxin-antitoxin system MqsA family antitoxin [Fibrella sp.]